MIILYLLFFGSFYLWNKLRNHDNLLLKPIILQHVLGAVCAIFLYYNVEAKENTLFSIVYQCLIIYLSITPIITYTRSNKKRIIPANLSLFNWTCYAFIGLGLLSLAHFIPAVIKVFTIGIALADLRNNMVYNGELMVETGIINTISGTIATFYPIMLLFYFYSICFLKKSKLFNSLLLLASTSYIFFVFSAIGRDGILFWCLTYIFGFCLFRPYMHEDIVKQTKKIFITVGLFGGVGFLLITLSRFFAGVGGELLAANGPIVSVIDYQGQVFNNFGQYIINVPPNYDSSSLIKLFEDVNLRDNFVSNGLDFRSKYGFASWIFKGFVSSFYSCMGVPISIVFFLLYAIWLSTYFKGNTCTLSKLIILTLCYQLPYTQYYYLKLASRVGNLYIISAIFLAWLFYINRPKLFN